jgi:glycosyltransferase involved in cell wall biosynthesis
LTAPLVTIGLTCFNAAETIGRALDSAMQQDWPNTEILVVDDASSDDSVSAIRARITGAPRARLVCHAENIGAGGARNTVLAEARGEFIAFFDDDDEAAPDRVSRQVACLEAHERRSGAHLVACYASGVRLYPNGYRVALPAIGSRDGAVPHGPDLAKYLLFFHRRPDWFYGSGTPTCSLLVRRSTLHAVGGFDVRLRRVQDGDLAIRLALQGGHFVGTREDLLIQHATGGNDKTPERMLEARLVLAEKYKDFLKDVGYYEYARRWPKIRHWHFKRQYIRFMAEAFGLFRRYPLAMTRHLLATGPKRVFHEMRMRRNPRQNNPGQ